MDRSLVHILGVHVDRSDRAAIRKRLERFLTDGTQHHVVTVNPEFLERAHRDPSFRTILNSADLAVADGTGVILASAFLQQRVASRLTGVELVSLLCDIAQDAGVSVAFVGGIPGVAPQAARALKALYPHLLVAMADTELRFHRRFHLAPCTLRERINRRHPGILFLAYGAPKQERWIAEHLASLPSVRIAVGVGGALDYFAGVVPYAPLLFRRAGLEWLYRLVRQPWRFPRILRATIVFPWLLIRHRHHV